MRCQRVQRRTVRRIDLLAVDEHLAVNAQHAQPAQPHQAIALLQRIVNLIRLIRRLGGATSSS
jgi:hypothetical protein